MRHKGIEVLFDYFNLSSLQEKPKRSDTATRDVESYLNRTVLIKSTLDRLQREYLTISEAKLTERIHHGSGLTFTCTLLAVARGVEGVRAQVHPDGDLPPPLCEMRR